MSRIGGSPITVPDGVSVAIENTQLTAKGSKGELVVELSNDVDVAVAENVVTITPKGKDKQSRAIWGTVRSNINNAVIGVSTGFTRKLEINGVGYRAAMQGNKLSLNLGYSHPVTMDVPAGLTVVLIIIQKSILAAQTSNCLASLLLRYVRNVHLSHLKARALNMLMSISYVKKVRRSKG